MEKTKCPFCGSEEIKIPTPFIDPVTGETIMTFCCKAQEKNNKYIERHTDPITGEKPDLEEVSKL